jgi:DNA-binding response OmpR family regulator
MNGKSVVIVEDDPDTSEMLAEMMRLIGYRVFQSSGVLQAVEMIAEKKPNAVLLDQIMPEFSGLEVLKSIRLDSHLRNIPVIIVSAKSQPLDVRQGLQAGAAFYLTKPVAFRDLKSAVEQATST